MEQIIKQSQKFLIAAEVYARTGSIREAARAAKVSEATVYNWRRQEDFIKLVNFFRYSFFEQLITNLAEAGDKAIKKLIQLLESQNEDTALAAASELLKFFELIKIEKDELKQAAVAGKIGFAAAETKSWVDILKELEEKEKNGSNIKKN
jgi:hypothetical protein